MNDVGFDGVLDVPDVTLRDWHTMATGVCEDCDHDGELHYDDGNGCSGCGVAWCGCPGHNKGERR